MIKVISIKMFKCPILTGLYSYYILKTTQNNENAARREAFTENSGPKQKQLTPLTVDEEVLVERDQDKISEDKTIDEKF